MAKILVIGAGVIGLQTTLTLLQAGYDVTVIAEHVPGDESIEYTSPWAGAIWRSHASEDDKEDCEWDIKSYTTWLDIMDRYPEQASGMGIQKCPITVFSETSKEPFYARHVHNYTSLGIIDSLESAHGHKFTSVAINPSTYLMHLDSQARSAGAHVLKQKLPTSGSLSAALSHLEALLEVPLDSPAIVVNCTGLSAQHLCGDQDLYPIRGQTLLARMDPPLKQEILLWEAKDAVTYIVPRPGTEFFVLGGTKTCDEYDPMPTPSISEDILGRCRRLLESRDLQVREIHVIKEQVGLRPGRNKGKRVVVENVQLDGRRTVSVVHNYGHAGTGYQASIGSAEKVLKFVREILRE